MIAEFRKVEDLTLDDLRAEVWLWRTGAAASLASLKVDVNNTSHRSAAGKEARREFRCLSEALTDALTGRYHDRCFACGFSIYPGDAVIYALDEGDMHASCPDQEGGAQAMKPGDKGEAAEKPDHIVAHEATRLYTHEQIVAKVQAP